MKKQLCLYSSVALAALLCGCTTLRVEQKDESPNERIITSEVTATAWFSSAQNLTKLKALQTDKTQSFGADTVAQQGATNAVAALEAIARIVEALRPAP